MRIKNIYISALCIFMFARAYTQQTVIDTTTVTEIDEIILTATRTARQLSSIPVPVTLISKDKITKSGSARLNEILNEQTGIITVPDESGFEGVQIQGISSDYIMILIDGVPLVGRSAGNFDLSRLTVGNIKQIEVVKGPTSSLYGSEALGGVINIITSKPKTEKLSGNASYRLGSFTQQDINLDLKQTVRDFSYAFFVNRFSSEGYDLTPETATKTVDPYSNYTVNGRFYKDFSKKLSLFTSARYYLQNQDANTTVDDIDYKGNTRQEEWNTHLRFDHTWNPDLNLAYELYYTNYTAAEKQENLRTNDVLTNSYFDRHLLRPEIRGTYAFKNNSKLTAGIGYQYDKLDRTYFDEDVAFNSQYIYAQQDISFFNKLNIIIGARFDNHSEYNNQLSPKLALRYKISNTLAIKGSVGYGFKAPDFRQLYFDFTNSTVGYTVLGYNVAIDKLRALQDQGQILDVVVPETELEDPLEAESSIGYNLGLTHKKGNWNTELNFFRNDIKNLIDTRIIARKTNGQNVFSYSNFDKVYSTGLEFNTSYNLSKNINIQAGYQLLYAFDKEKETLIKNGEVYVRDPATNQTIALTKSDYFGLVNRSRHNANLKIFYNIPSIGANFNARLLYRSKYGQYDTNGNNLIDTYDTSYVDGYLTTNVAASKTFYKNFNLQIGFNNLFDHKDNAIPSLSGIQSYAKINYQF